MTDSGSILRLAGTTLIVVVIAGCGGIGRANRADAAATPVADPAADAAADAEGSLGNVLDGDGVSDEDLAAEFDALLSDPALDALDGAPLATGDPGAAASGAATGVPPSKPTGGAAATSKPEATLVPLPAFEAGSFADLDAALSTLDLALGAAEAGSEGNLP